MEAHHGGASVLFASQSRQFYWRLYRAIVADAAGDVSKPFNEGLLGNGNSRVGFGEHIVHDDDVAVLDVCKHLLAKHLAGRILDCAHILPPQPWGADEQGAGVAVETKHIEVAVLKTAVWGIEFGQRAGPVGLDGGDGL